MNTVLRRSRLSRYSSPRSPSSAREYTFAERYAYAGERILPSIFKESTPMSLSFSMQSAPNRSVQLRRYPDSPSLVYFFLQGWAQEPRFPLRPPMKLDMRHPPDMQ